MSFSDPSVPPTFSEAARLFDLSPREARFRHAQARDRMLHQQSEMRYAIANANLDAQRVEETRIKLERVQRDEKEAQKVLALLEDTAFRRELMTLDTHWRRFRMSHPVVTNDRFADVMMSIPEEQTVDLRASWRTICNLIASHATATPKSAFAL
ncbi:hypothetical protein HY733_03330 [Candidatus Uhrbacteria bacterium]|nr:hypothetical protein [Candidatus Uhrbacteria bacterium]